jgi:hypothetical protein
MPETTCDDLTARPRGTWLLAWHDYLVLDEPVGGRTPETTGSVEAARRFDTWEEAKGWAVGLWGDDVLDDPRVFPITVDQLAAVRAFKAEHGYRWKSLLSWEWDRGDCEPELRQLRNALGPRWLYRQRLV